jgi:hypothetical protein
MVKVIATTLFLPPPHRMQMRRNPNRRRDDHEVFDNILTLESWDHKPTPCLRRQQKQRTKCRNHVHKQKRYNDPFRSFDQKQYSNQTFKQTKRDEKRIETHKRYSLFEKSLDQATCRAQPYHLQYSKPKEYNKESDTRSRYAYFSEKMNNASIKCFK